MSKSPDKSTPIVPAHLPIEMPRIGNRITRKIGRILLTIMGWRVEGELPAVPKAVFAAAPHTSNWDFIVAMAAVLALGVKISYLMKKEAFFWPFKNLFMSLGGIPLDRKAADDTVGQLTKWYDQNEKIWVVITPEGTRSRVGKWKTGFLRVAHRANVPVILVAWDYPTKTMHIDRLWHASDNFVSDAEQIREYMCAKYTGRHKDKQ